jgi:hypothetical protein
MEVKKFASAICIAFLVLTASPFIFQKHNLVIYRVNGYLQVQKAFAFEKTKPGVFGHSASSRGQLLCTEA